jgi:hypothetical protein
LASYDTNFIGLDSDVKQFYASLHNKDWRATYNQRWDEFREDFPMRLYLQIADADGAKWELLDYDILSVEANGDNEVNLICKYTETFDNITYAMVRWRKEDGVWRCDAAGPKELKIFRYTRRN